MALRPRRLPVPPLFDVLFEKLLFRETPLREFAPELLRERIGFFSGGHVAPGVKGCGEWWDVMVGPIECGP